MHPRLHPDIRESFRSCRSYTREHAKAFFFASYALPRDQRYAAYAVYAFCRKADNLVDTAGPAADPRRVREGIEMMRSELERVYTDLPAQPGDLLAFRHTALAYGIPRVYFDDLLRGVEMDLQRDRYDTFDELREYCYCVASVVGLVMTRIFGTSNDAALGAAADLGTAMQLTNILRDVGEDRRMGRVYLPLEDLDRFRYREDDLAREVINENFIELMRFQIARAHTYYRRSEAGIPMITGASGRRTVRIMGRSYRRILDKIEQNQYDVFARRAFVPLPEKVLIAAGSLVPGPGERNRIEEPGAMEQHRLWVDHADHHYAGDPRP